MVRVAIAGGSGGVGQVCAEALTKSGHTVTILSRSMKGGATRVDYCDIQGIANALEHHNIEVVICTFYMFNEDAQFSEINLVKAAVKAGCVKRFIPSEFGAVPK